MRPVRVLICDDEPLALDRLGDLLGQCPEVELVGAVRDGAEALEQIPAVRPDLVMLDIEMPRLDGFDVVEALLRRDWADPEAAPLICFVTAYPAFASEAFESGALDFLSKPVRLARLAKTIERARVALDQREAVRRLGELSGQLESLRRESRPQEDRFLWIQRSGEMVRLDIADLDWLQAEGEYVRLHVGDRSYLFRGSMTSVTDQLEPYGIVRIHRSAAINGRRLEAVRRSRGGGMRVALSTGVELAVGRKFRERIRSLTRPFS
jgi:DNA-binding LytR/AlgR family response regulator